MTPAGALSAADPLAVAVLRVTGDPAATGAEVGAGASTGRGVGGRVGVAAVDGEPPETRPHATTSGDSTATISRRSTLMALQAAGRVSYGTTQSRATEARQSDRNAPGYPSECTDGACRWPRAD
jgi:hypothetical protein